MMDGYFIATIERKINDSNSLSFYISEVKNKLNDERINFRKEAQSIGNNIITENLFNSYTKCIALENELKNETQRLIYIYASGLSIIIKLLDEYRFHRNLGMPYSIIKKYILSLYNDKNTLEYIYMLLPYFSDIEFLILKNNDQILNALILDGIQKLQNRATKFKPIVL